MKREFDRMMRDESGAVALVVAVLLVVFLILSAFVVDMGYWYTTKRQLQSAADAAALAGCRELTLGNTNSDVWQAVEEYAALNAGTPVENHSVVAPSPGGLSDITDDSVKVTVTTESPSFFARVMGIASADISAQARAEVAYLAGARNPMPWALPILRVTRATASIGGGPEYDLSPDAGSGWSGYLPSGTAGDVDIIAYNDQTLDPNYPDGVPEEIESAARVTRIPADSRILSVTLPKTTFTAEYGEYASVFVSTTEELEDEESVAISIGKSDVVLTQTGPTSYAGSIAAPSTDDLWASYYLDVEIRDEKNKIVEEVAPAAVLLSRRSTYPIKDVRVTPNTVRAGDVAAPRVEVEFNDYEYGNVYELKVIGGAGEQGNFMAIDFHTLRHPPYWRYPQDPAEYPELPGSTSTYYEYIAGTAPYEFIMHVGDTVWTEPGNMSGPQTRAALDTRFAGEPSDFDGWVASGMPGTRRLVYIPITEKVQETTGITPLRVVSFATFYVESVSNDSGGALVRGRFVEYVAPGWVTSPSPPDPAYAIKTMHLTSEGLDF